MTPLPLAALAASPFIGSFVAVLADRLPRGETVLLGRSACRSCSQVLGPRDLVPVLSWVALRGRCRQCGAPIGLVAPAAELGGLAVALSAVAILPEGLILPGCLLGWMLLALALIDLDRLVLPDRLTVPLALAGLAMQGWWRASWPTDALLGMAAGGAALAVVALLYRRARGRDGMGWGDVKLFAAGGAWVGWEGQPSVLLLASLLGLAAALLSGASLRSATRYPFGPALAAAIWIVFLCGPLEIALP